MPGVPGRGAVLAAEQEDCGPTSTRLALPDNSQAQREAIRGNRAALNPWLAAKAKHGFTLDTKLNI